MVEMNEAAVAYMRRQGFQDVVLSVRRSPVDVRLRIWRWR